MRSRDIGRKVRAIREALGITGPKLCKEVGFAQAQLSRLENGAQGFRAETFLAICKALDLPPLYFFVEDDRAFTAALSGELKPKEMKISRDLQRGLANPVFLRFMELWAAEAGEQKQTLDRMTGAAKDAADFPPGMVTSCPHP